MAWAIVLTTEDLAEMEAGLNTAGMSAPDRASVRQYTQAGFANSANAPVAPSDHPCYQFDGTNLRVMIINTGSLADFRNLLKSLIQKYPSAAVLTFYSDYIAKPQYGIDPYPPPANYFTGMTCT